MPENKNPSDVSYEIEDAKPKKAKGFGKSRGAKIAAITVGAVVALAASFGIGVAAGVKIAEHNPGSFSQGGQFGPGQGFGDGYQDDLDGKSYEGRARAVRRFNVQSLSHSTAQVAP